MYLEQGRATFEHVLDIATVELEPIRIAPGHCLPGQAAIDEQGPRVGAA